MMAGERGAIVAYDVPIQWRNVRELPSQIYIHPLAKLQQIESKKRTHTKSRRQRVSVCLCVCMVKPNSQLKFETSKNGYKGEAHDEQAPCADTSMFGSKSML